MRSSPSATTPRAAQSYGINRVRAELTAFGLAGFLAALAGGVFVYHQHGISRSVLETPGNLRVFSIAVIGGLGSIPGALFGAAYQTFLDYSPFTRVPESQYFASGAGLLFILLVFPAGLGGLLYDIRDSLLRRVARRSARSSSRACSPTSACSKRARAARCSRR